MTDRTLFVVSCSPDAAQKGIVAVYAADENADINIVRSPHGAIPELLRATCECGMCVAVTPRGACRGHFPKRDRPTCEGRPVSSACGSCAGCLRAASRMLKRAEARR